MMAIWRTTDDHGTYAGIMTIFSHTTALALLRARCCKPVTSGSVRFESIPIQPIAQVSGAAFANGKPPATIVKAVQELSHQPEGPVHFLALREHRTESLRSCCHIALPRTLQNNVVAFSESIACTSPELTFHHLCGALPLANALAIGFELCGCYSLASSPDSSESFLPRAPLTSPNLIYAFLENNPHLKKRQTTLKILRYVIANSGSPMETCLVIVLTLPKRLGGYGLPAPLLNHKVVSSGHRGKGREGAYYIDLFWPDFNLAVEYDSDAHHFSNPAQSRHDSDRRLELRRLGIETISVTSSQMRTTSTLDKTAEAIASAMGIRLRLGDTSQREKRMALHGAIFPGTAWDNQVPCECYFQR